MKQVQYESMQTTVKRRWFPNYTVHRGIYLLLQLLPELLGFALLVVVHDHHSCVDLPNGHMIGWKNGIMSLIWNSLKSKTTIANSSTTLTNARGTINSDCHLCGWGRAGLASSEKGVAR